jgi:hypothetical protein
MLSKTAQVPFEALFAVYKDSSSGQVSRRPLLSKQRRGPRVAVLSDNGEIVGLFRGHTGKEGELDLRIGRYQDWRRSSPFSFSLRLYRPIIPAIRSTEVNLRSPDSDGHCPPTRGGA